MLDIKGSVAVITGGSGGIGMALAQYWVKQGGKAVIADIAEDALKSAKEILGENVEPFVCDVTSEEDSARLAAFAIEKFGRINLVAPFAGIIKDGMMVSPDRETGKVTRKMSLEDFQKVVDINLTGVFLTVRECSEQMINHGCRGLICLVSSTGSLGTAGQINYSSTKAAMSRPDPAPMSSIRPPGGTTSANRDKNDGRSTLYAAANSSAVRPNSPNATNWASCCHP